MLRGVQRFSGRVQETFGVRGLLWWLRWLLPSLSHKRSSGLHSMANFAVSTQYAAVAGTQHLPWRPDTPLTTLTVQQAIKTDSAIAAAVTVRTS